MVCQGVWAEVARGHSIFRRAVVVEMEASASAIQKAYSPSSSSKVVRIWETTTTFFRNFRVEAEAAEVEATEARDDTKKPTDTADIEP